jgi:peptidoglycan/xylan/chitin deacetylase (PgdA/CDA1 family)
MTATVPVLMYHSVSATPPRATRRLSVHPDTFDEHLKLLRVHGYTTLTFAGLGEALRRGTPLYERSIVLTFDDGYADFHEHALPALERHGATATVFVTTGWLDDAGDAAAGTPLDRMLSWRQVREVHGAGVEIGAHSHSHPQLDQLPDTDLRHELSRSKELLESRLGTPVASLAYPFGYSSRRVREEAAATGYRFAAAVDNRVQPKSDLLALPRLTIRRATSKDTVERILSGEHVHRPFAVDRTLTRGYSVVRRARRGVRLIGERVMT